MIKNNRVLISFFWIARVKIHVRIDVIFALLKSLPLKYEYLQKMNILSIPRL